MPFSPNEIRTRAQAFSKEWAGETRERSEAQTFLNEFFDVFGVRRRRVASFEAYKQRLGQLGGFVDLFWPGTLIVEMKAGGESLDSAAVQAGEYMASMKEREHPQYVMVSDFARIRLYDLEAEDEADRIFECSLEELPKHIRRFNFIAGYTTRTYKDEDPVNAKAVKAVKKLHDALKESGYSGHVLESLLVRLVFCFFADDVGIFKERDAFRSYIEERTSEDGSDLGQQLTHIFQILNTPTEERQTNLDDDLARFTYVDGPLFREQLPIPSLSSAMRELLLDCVGYDWALVSPAIFGSMFQRVMDEDLREDLGAHYTSEKNILKVVKGLFLDELWAEYERVKDGPRMLKDFHEKLARLKFLDPACGCGNFLVVTYRELRLLELEVLKRLHADDRQGALLNIASYSKIDVDCMYGMEIAEFPALIAELALWLTDHQMNQKLGDEFGAYYARLPLKTIPNIHVVNAMTKDWEEIVPKDELSFIMGNPPFFGSRVMSTEQKAEIRAAFENMREVGFLDYVTGWYIKAAKYIQGTPIRAAFVSTNSISQGEQVGILWEKLFSLGIKIHFAHRTFRWTNEAPGGAGVYCIIIGFGIGDEGVQKRLYEYEEVNGDPSEAVVANINPYLVDAPDDAIVRNRQNPLCDVPELVYGNMARGKGFVLTEQERNELVEQYPQAEPFVRLYIGAQEFLYREKRYCLWLVDAPPSLIRDIPLIRDRVAQVREERLKSRAESTRRMAETPHLFAQRTQPESDYILIPRVTLEDRQYIPMDFVSRDVIVGDSLALPGAGLYHLGVLMSSMHMAWVRYTCGRLEGRYRYSKDVVYNNYPWPQEVTEADKRRVEEAAQGVLDARAQYPNEDLATLYGADTMPEPLVRAHRELNAAVDRCYGQRSFRTEYDRVQFLFDQYRELAVADAAN